MGDTGPCGPCSEIFYDHGDKYWGGPPGSPEEDGDRFVEIWNLVFMQFEQLPDGSRISLPKPSVDTGSGLERVAAVMQGTNNNYEIDLFRSLISATQQATGFSGDPTTPSLRVIADHLRAMSLQRGSRLCASAHHAPCHAPRDPARRQRAGDSQAGPCAREGNGPGLPGARSGGANGCRDHPP